MARIGSQQKRYRASWGKDIQGLYKCPDDRWGIGVTGRKVTEADERRAVDRFGEWDAKNTPSPTRAVDGDYAQVQPETETMKNPRKSVGPTINSGLQSGRCQDTSIVA
jgi:hypothetical protein